jgi:hypothetical protein
MKLSYPSLKNLLNYSQSINISDSLPLDLIMRLAEEAGKEEKTLTIRVKKLGVEDLKRIAKKAKKNISFYIEEEQE